MSNQTGLQPQDGRGVAERQTHRVRQARLNLGAPSFVDKNPNSILVQATKVIE